MNHNEREFLAFCLVCFLTLGALLVVDSYHRKKMNQKAQEPGMVRTYDASEPK